MWKILQSNENRFLADEFFAGAWNAAVSRNSTFIKLNTKKLKGRKVAFRNCLYDAIFEMLPSYAETQVSHEQHLENIKALIKASEDFSTILKNYDTEKKGYPKPNPNAKRIKAATAQKILNVMLKYCWCAGWIKMPSDMPIDSRVLTELRKLDKNAKQFQISWTKELKEIKDYDDVIKAAKSTVDEPLAIWELKNWQHYDKEDKESSDNS